MSRVDDLWFDDGNIIVRVGDYIFRLYSGMLSRECGSFMQHTRPEAEAIDGCDVITLVNVVKDAEAENVLVFLLHIFKPAQAYYCLTARNIFPILCLSENYGANNVKEQLKRIISSMYPTSYDAFLASQLPTHISAAPFDYTTLLSNVDFANAAREHDMLAYLPVALYRLCKLDQKAVYDSGLSPPNLRALVIGRPQLSANAKNLAFGSIPGKCREGVFSCQVARTELARSLAGADGWVDPFQTCVFMGICLECTYVMRNNPNHVWRNLPAYFEVQSMVAYQW